MGEVVSLSEGALSKVEVDISELAIKSREMGISTDMNEEFGREVMIDFGVVQVVF